MKRRRFFKSLWALLLILSIVFQGGDTFGAGSPIVQIARPHLFSIAGWEMGNFHRKWTHAFRELFPGSKTDEEKAQQVRRYFELTERINGVEAGLKRVLAAVDTESDPLELEDQLAELQAERGKLEPSVERTLEGMISHVLKEHDLFSRFLFLRQLWPPVDLRLSTVPKILIVSPRDRILLQQTHLLDSDITAAEIESLERTIDARDLSSLVQSSGGVATYPSLVPDNRSLETVLNVTSHEWVHHYLFFHALGRGYRSSDNMTTINETVADIVGQEIGREVYRRYFASPDEPVSPPEPAPPDDEAPAFDFNEEMRETRLTAERMLAEGNIEGAEAYMEQRRLFLAENGHLFRKLNQAFFAFHGTYADRPGAVSPIGEQLRGLREQSPTLSDFLFRVARYSSYDDLKQDLGIEE